MKKLLACWQSCWHAINSGVGGSRRLNWLGKVLSREEDFLARQFILAEADSHGNSVRGSILNDIPHIDNARDLVSLAEDLDRWSDIMTDV